MNQKKLIIRISIGIALAASGYGMYKYFFQNGPADAPKNMNTRVDLETKLSGLSRLKGSKLDTSLFQDPIFKILESPAGVSGLPEGQNSINPSGVVSESKIGRANPFNPF